MIITYYSSSWGNWLIFRYSILISTEDTNLYTDKRTFMGSEHKVIQYTASLVQMGLLKGVVAVIFTEPWPTTEKQSCIHCNLHPSVLGDSCELNACLDIFDGGTLVVLQRVQVLCYTGECCTTFVSFHWRYSRVVP